MSFYFVSFTTIKAVSPNGDYVWAPAMGVINRHPFEFIRDQQRASPPVIVSAVLVNWQQITEEEYDLYDQLFKK